MTTPLHISAAFDSGNIEVLDQADPAKLRLAIRPDVGDEHMQWFHFRVSGARDQPLTLRIENASKASYPHAWVGYQACRSVDRESWTRVPTRYEAGALIIEDTPPGDVAWYAYFAPYAHERLQDLLGAVQQVEGVRVRRLGSTIDGRDLDVVTVGEAASERRTIWITARQHPGESMASWWVEGFLNRLLDPDDALARVIRGQVVVNLIPNMNPDGSFRGHLRCNAVGANLNREWHAPTMERSPEVYLALAAMDQTGVDLALDVHGDEDLPYNFISGAEGIPGYTERQAALDLAFRRAYERANPDFQRVQGYPLEEAGQANMSMCSNQVAARFNCLALTLEMPFKDNADHPEPVHGWSPERAAALGASALDAIAAVLPQLA